MVVLAEPPVVADTDIVIDFLRGRSPGSTRVREWLGEGRLRLTAVTAFELRLGEDFFEREHSIVDLLSGRTLPVDAPAAVHAGDIFVRLRTAGLEIGVKDCLQAGVCRRFDLPLCTGNVRHFDRVGGLRMVLV